MNKPSLSLYAWTFAALMLLLAATIGAAYLDLGRLNLPVAMAISVAKTLLILLCFMHLKSSSPLTWLVAGAGFFWLGILLALAMADYFSRGL